MSHKNKNTVASLFKKMEFDSSSTDEVEKLIRGETDEATIIKSLESDEFFKGRNKTFKQWLDEFQEANILSDKSFHESEDSQGNKIFLQNVIYLHDDDDESEETIDLRKIATELKRNALFFAKLNFILRKVPIKDTLQYDIPIIVDLFNFFAEQSHIDQTTCCKFEYEYYASQPFFILGLIAPVLTEKTKKRIDIRVHEETAILAVAFAHKCLRPHVPKELINIIWEIRPNDVTSYCTGLKDKTNIATYQKDGVAIVDETADVAAAAHCFKRATTNITYPWRLTRVLVQESLFDELQAEIGSSKLTIEAYRTIEEGIRLAGDCFALSLWSSERNDSTWNSAKAHIVWMNNFGTEKPLQLFYRKISIIDVGPVNFFQLSISTMPTTLKIHSAWQSLKESDRKLVLKKAIESSKGQQWTEKEAEVISALSNADVWSGPPSSVHIDNDTMCLTVGTPIGVVYNLSITFDLQSKCFSDLILSTLKGNTLVVTSKNTQDFSKIINLFVDSGLPIEKTDLNVFLYKMSLDINPEVYLPKILYSEL